VINLQDGSQRVPAAVLQRIWFFAPIVAGGAIAALLTGLVLVPMGVQLNKDRERVAELEALQSEVVVLRRELSTLEENRDQAQRQRGVLINLLAGNRDIGTFLAQLDKEANASGVTLRLFEPQAVAAAPGQPGQAPAPGQPGQPAPGQPGQPAPGQPAQPGQAPPSDPLALEGLERRQLLLQAQGPYPNLVAFLRRIEKLDVLVGQDSLNLQVEPLPVEALRAGKRVMPPKVSLRQSLLLYNKKPTLQPGAPAAANQPGAAPVPGQAAPPPAGSPAPPG
jgi:type IV pilus assembly protein PilO